MLTISVRLYAASGQGSSSPTVTVFLDDNVFALNSTRPNPVDLGSFPYQCVGNVELCINGFTIGLWYRPSPGVFSVGASCMQDLKKFKSLKATISKAT